MLETIGTILESVRPYGTILLLAIVLQGGIALLAWGRELHLRELEEIPLNIPKADWDFIMTPPVIGPICIHDYENYINVTHFSCGFIMRQRLDSEIVGEGTFR